MGLSSSDGVKISINQYMNEIYSDERGPNIPSEVLRNGGDAKIEFELWKFDTAVVNSLLASRDGGVQGRLGLVGELMFYNNLPLELTIASPVDGQNWYFPRTWLLDEGSVQLSTQLKIWTMTIKAVPGPSINGDQSQAVLYQFI